MEKRLQLINVNSEEGREEGAPLFDPNGNLDEVRKALCHPEATKIDSYNLMMSIERVLDMPMPQNI